MEDQIPPVAPQNQGAPFGQNQFGQMSSPRPKNWLVESILVTIFCCLPFGIAGIVNAANVNSRYDTGDHAGALAASQAAGKWTKIGFFLGIAGIIIYMIMIFVFGYSAFRMNGM